ncbi:hypothetical protein MtrunA17_Chr6g0483171 [Medicago truncatula]|uniref:Multi antimicrobial extrusion protein n=1 Tax=Medicago truncatula TaxID=3880 RepID=A0A396HLB4_MEDTR|nr:hypothetical protein MtrunA17_Chr6g0483171 [Medicago truncatula]
MKIERKEIIEEAKKQLWLAVPMVIVCIFQNLQIITLMFVGHLNQDLLLAGASLAISILNVIGFNVMVSILNFTFQFFLVMFLREYMKISWICSLHTTIMCLTVLRFISILIFV